MRKNKKETFEENEKEPINLFDFLKTEIKVKVWELAVICSIAIILGVMLS